MDGWADGWGGGWADGGRWREVGSIVTLAFTCGERGEADANRHDEELASGAQLEKMPPRRFIAAAGRERNESADLACLLGESAADMHSKAAAPQNRSNSPSVEVQLTVFSIELVRVVPQIGADAATPPYADAAPSQVIGRVLHCRFLCLCVGVCFVFVPERHRIRVVIHTNCLLDDFRYGLPPLCVLPCERVWLCSFRTPYWLWTRLLSELATSELGIPAEIFTEAPRAFVAFVRIRHCGDPP